MDKITVSEVCNKANINRKTFYAHYADIYALMEALEHQSSKIITSFFTDGKARDIGDGFLRLFEFIHEHRAFYKPFLCEHGTIRALDAIISYENDPNIHSVTTFIGYSGKREFNYHSSFFKAGLTAMIKEWLMADCPETPEEMMKILGREYHQNRDIFKWH